MAPIIGAIINNQTCLSTSPPCKTAGAKLLAGLTLVPVKGIPIKCTKISVIPIIKPAILLFSFLSVMPRIVVTKIKVKITSIRNTENKHIVINAEASKYEQLGYFRAAISTSGYLTNVKSTSGTKSGGTVVITIEGDLP